MPTALKIRRYKAGYEVRTEEFSGNEAGLAPTETMVMQSAYTPQGQYIGDPKTARRLIVQFGIKPELRQPGLTVCTVGFSARTQKWYGWSHRGIQGFGIGDDWATLDFDGNGEPYMRRRFPAIRTLDEARQAACDFAESIA